MAPDLLEMTKITIFPIFWDKTIVANFKTAKTVLSLKSEFFLVPIGGETGRVPIIE